MSEQLRYTIQGRMTNREDFVTIAKRLVQEVETTEPTTLAYEWFAHDDGTFFIHAIYATSEAFVDHFQKVNDNGMLEELQACWEPEQVLVLSRISPAAKTIADQFGARYLHGLGGVAR